MGLNKKPLTFSLSIVFIHGLTGDRDATWTASDATDPWPKTLLPPVISTARVLTFGYDANVADWKGVVSQSRIANHAGNLLTALSTYRENDDTVGSPVLQIREHTDIYRMNDRSYFSAIA